MNAEALVYVGLGSNLGDRFAHLQAGLAALAAHRRVRPVAVSGVWETEHVGDDRQGPHLNAVAALRSDLSPAVLLSLCKRHEAAAGRAPGTHLRPRTIDLDLLLVGERVQRDCEPLLPHPRLGERAFVLVPLAEIAPGRRLPDSGETAAEACARITRDAGPWLRPRPDLRLALAGAGKEANARGSVALHRR